ncbi:uncharacterized protein LOC117300206 [Asterias rubens]|uniref:uncharacterized protein LOC117300206 n=1 Tax=Asterias rubens TaxID=7604 RepID=UPI001455B4B2|nr:uncharacterized protein LOC117300206 [Asterias rubens]
MENHLLTQSIINETNAPNILGCAGLCLRFPCCRSVNYNGETKRCLLSNDTGVEVTSGRVDIIDGWMLLMPKQPIGQCVDMPCQNGANCNAVCVDGTDMFTCDCLAGTLGVRCHITDECNIAIGMESMQIPDALISASSFEDTDHAAHKARLHLPAVSWTAESTDTTPWLKVDLLRLTDVTGVAIQGSGQSNQGWVTKFTISFLDESDGETEVVYTESSGEEQTFDGNIDVSGEEKYHLYPIIQTRSLTFHFLEWNEKCSARVEIYGCSDEEWILAFKGRAETGYDIYDAWVSPDDDLTQIWADRELQRPHHYRNNAVFNKWSQLPITEVKFSLFAVEPAIVELLKMKFQGEGSDYKSWFKTSTILESPWSDLTAGSTVYIGSMEGSDVTIGKRRFQFESCVYSGCYNDCGWLVVPTCGSPCTCAFEAELSGRNTASKIIYCKKTSSCRWIDDFAEVGFADALTIHVKF